MTSIFLKSRRARPFFGRHPWVFDSAIARIDGPCQPGSEITLVSNKGEFIAYGLYNPHSKIRVRLYSWDDKQPITDEFIADRIRQAILFRKDQLRLCGPKTGCRLFFSESDGLSGLTIDQYDSIVVLQVTSLALHTRMDAILSAVREQLKPTCIYLRTEKGIAEQEGLQQTDGLLEGVAPEAPVLIEENGVEFLADVQTGQKTGLYLDQRDNRQAVCRYTQGKSVLDVFCHTGAFSLYAMKQGGATSALAIDVSKQALDHGALNAERNGVAVDFQKSEAVPAMKKLHQQGRTFGVVVCDPPKFARSAGAIDRALRGYEQVNQLAMQLVEPGGILVTCSCSGLVASDQFLGVLTNISQANGRELQLLEMRGQAPDHPVSLYCPETAYLKCAILRVR